MTDEEQAQQLHRCLGNDSLPLDVRTAGSLTLLFGPQHTKLLELTVRDAMDDNAMVALNLAGHHLPLPPEVARLVRAQRDLLPQTPRLPEAVGLTSSRVQVDELESTHDEGLVVSEVRATEVALKVGSE